MGRRLPLSWAPWALVRLSRRRFRRHHTDERNDAGARRGGGAATTAKCSGSACGATARKRPRFAAPGFLPLMALAALVMSSDSLHDGFEVLRWEDGGIGRGAAGLLWSEGVLAEVVVLR